MRRLVDRTEIAEAINFGKYPVLKIDLADADEYGLKGSICRVDMGSFRDGTKWYEKARLKAYAGEDTTLTFDSSPCILSAHKNYRDFMDDVDVAMSPIVKPNSEFVLVVHDSSERKVHAVYIVRTCNVMKHCVTPIHIEVVDMQEWIDAAYRKEA